MDWQEKQDLQSFCERKAAGASLERDWVNMPEARGLCVTCDSSTIYKRKSQNKVTIICNVEPLLLNVHEGCGRRIP